MFWSLRIALWFTRLQDFVYRICKGKNFYQEKQLFEQCVTERTTLEIHQMWNIFGFKNKNLGREVEDCKFYVIKLEILTILTSDISVSYLTLFVFSVFVRLPGMRPHILITVCFSYYPLFFNILAHTQRRTTIGRTPLDESSARLRDLYLTTHNTCKRQNIHAPGEIWNRNPASERLQTYALNLSTNGTSHI